MTDDLASTVRLATALRAVDEAFDWRDLADIVWLLHRRAGEHGGVVDERASSADEVMPSPPVDDVAAPVPAPAERAHDTRAPSDPVATSAGPTSAPRISTPNSARPNLDERLGVAAPHRFALPRRHEIERALKPLRRRARTSRRRELDVTATVDRFCDTGIMTPVLRRAKEPWLDAALVVDRGPSMEIWHDAAEEFADLVERSGVFRNVTRWTIDTRHEPPTLGPDVARRRASHRADELIDPSGRRVIILLSDGISPAWNKRGVWSALDTWGRWSSTVVMRPLAESAAARTPLGAGDIIVRATSAATPTARLLKERPWWLDEAADAVVPVVPLAPAAIRGWAHFVAGAAGTTLAAAAPDPGGGSEAGGGPRISDDRLRDVINTALSADAHRLGVLLSATPLSVDVARIVMERMLPESDLADLGELLALRVLTFEDDRLTFAGRAGDVFRGMLTSTDALRVWLTVSPYLERVNPESAPFVVLDARPGAPATPEAAAIVKQLSDRFGFAPSSVSYGADEQAPAPSEADLFDSEPSEAPAGDEALGEMEAVVPAEVAAGEEFEVRVRLREPHPSLAGRPLRAVPAPLEPLTVTVMARGARTRPGRRREQVSLSPSDIASECLFRLTAVDVGPAMIQVIVHQESDIPLGFANVAFNITPGPPPVARTTLSVRTLLFRPDPALAALPTLRVDEEVSGGESSLFVHAHVGGEWAEGSVPLPDKAALIASVEETVDALRTGFTESTAEESALLARTGDSLARVLLPPEVRTLLWRMRENLDGLVFLTNGEVDLAWEFVAITPPSGEPERGRERLLGRTGMVRWLYDAKHPWRVDIAPGSVVAITPRYESPRRLEFAGDELRRLTSTLGVTPRTRIDAAEMGALVRGDWAVLHFTGHGGRVGAPSAPWGMMLSDALGGVGSPTYYSEDDLIRDISTSEATAQSDGGPLVVLNTSVPPGVLGAVVRGGAAVCIGQSALIADERAASAFVEAFYRALLDGETLGDATRIARRATAQNHDVVDPGFVVYGNPLLRIRLQNDGPPTAARDQEGQEATRTPSVIVTGQPIREIVAIPTSGDRALLAVGSDDGYIRVWDGEVGRTILASMSAHDSWVGALASVRHLDGRITLASGAGDGALRLWDPFSGSPLGEPLTGHRSRVRALAAVSLPDGREGLASCSDDRTVRLWDPVERIPLTTLSGHSSRVRALAVLSPSAGTVILASGGDDRTIRLWDALAGVPFGSPLTGHSGAVRCLTGLTLPDGRMLLASGSDDRTVRLWDPVTLTPVGGPWTGHTAAVRALVAITDHDGRVIVVSGSDDQTVRVWDPARGVPIDVPWTGHTAPVRAIAAISRRDGTMSIASTGGDGTIRFWDDRISRVQSIASNAPAESILMDSPAEPVDAPTEPEGVDLAPLPMFAAALVLGFDVDSASSPQVDEVISWMTDSDGARVPEQAVAVSPHPADEVEIDEAIDRLVSSAALPFTPLFLLIDEGVFADGEDSFMEVSDAEVQSAVETRSAPAVPSIDARLRELVADLASRHTGGVVALSQRAFDGSRGEGTFFPAHGIDYSTQGSPAPHLLVRCSSGREQFPLFVNAMNDLRGMMSATGEDLLAAVRAWIEIVGIEGSGLPALVLIPAEEELKQLARDYDEIRETMPSGDARTDRMTRTFRSMLERAPRARALSERLARSSSAGERLAAIAIFYVFPQVDRFGWLAERLDNPTTEAPFIGFQSAMALDQAVRKLSPEASPSPELTSALRLALRLARKLPEDPDRIAAVEGAIARLESRSPGADAKSS